MGQNLKDKNNMVQQTHKRTPRRSSPGDLQQSKMEQCYGSSGKKHWQKIQTSPDPTMHSLLGEPWGLWLENKKVSTAGKHWLLEHTCRQAT